MGILKRKIRSLNLPRRIALILMRIIIYNKVLIEEWVKNKYFNQLELLLLRIWREIVKRFVQCQAFMDSSFPKRGPICSEMSVRNYQYSLRSNPEYRIYEGSTVLWNSRSYRPNDTVSQNVQFSVKHNDSLFLIITFKATCFRSIEPSSGLSNEQFQTQHLQQHVSAL